MKLNLITSFVRLDMSLHRVGLHAGLLVGCAAALIGCDASSGYQDDASYSQDPDPVVVDYPIAYIERPIPRDEDGVVIADNVLDPGAFKPGARLIIKERASVPAAETVITDNVFIDPDADPDMVDPDAMTPLYDVKDLSVSRDGLKLLFSMRAPEDENADEDEQPTWNIWEYDSETQELRRIIQSDLVAELGEDVAPKYLANGDIVFSSTRQPRSKAILLDENKPQFDPGTEDDRDEATFALHTMEDDGTEIRQITFNQSHDLSPEVLENGDIVFLRWNNYVGGSDRVSLYSAKPDGSGVGPYYGYHSQNTGSDDTEAVFAKPVQAPDGRLLVNLKSRVSEVQGGDITLVDGANYVEIDRLIDGTVSGEGQVSASAGEVTTDDSVSPAGYYSSVYPMFDGTERIIASWSACLVEGVSLNVFVHQDGTLVNGLGQSVDRDGNVLADGTTPITPDMEEIGRYPCGRDIQILDELSAPEPSYGIWTFDPFTLTQRPVVLAQEGMIYTEAVVMETRPPLGFEVPAPPDEATQALIDANLGVVHIRSVYDYHGLDNTTNGIDAMADPLQTSPAERPARFIRIVKAVSLPNEDVYDFDNSAFGRSGGQMKDIIGYVPVEPDGSAKFAVPADIAFTLSILDANGRRVPGYLGDRHENWISVRPGETLECGRCYANLGEVPHGRDAISSWGGALGGAQFPNTVLLDQFDTPHQPPEVGQTMAEYYAAMNNVREPTVNIEFVDDWSDESIVAKAASYELNYADMESTAHPTTPACQSNWNGLCRIVINYIDHIQPVWDAPRQLFDDVDPTLLIEDRTCTTCHSAADEMGQAQVPAGQLELVSDQSADRNDYFTSYAELLFADVPQVVIDGVLQDEQEQATDEDGNLLFRTDADGNLILDDDGNPIPILVTVAPRGAYLSPAGARNNATFFAQFGPGGTHEDYLNAAELRLISEWLDIGAQYYNNPFEAPE